MNWSRLRNSGNENVFKGSQLVTSILERHNQHFRSRATALKFCRQLFNDGVIRGVFGATTFEDSVQLYAWHDSNKVTTKMTSHPPSHMSSPASSHASRSPKSYGYSSADITVTRRELYKQKETIKPIDHSSRDSSAHQPEVPYSHDVNSYFRDIQNSISGDGDRPMTSHAQISSYQTSWNLQRASTASSESSVDILSHSYGKHKDKPFSKSSMIVPHMSSSRDHDVIPEEAQEDQVPVMERTTTSTEYDGTSSFPRSVTTTDTSAANEVDATTHARWQQDYQNSYSDNEKQLIEQMKRMKKEHSHILRTYEDRINKLMAKMHELRSIAEMLENSSTKSSPYGMIHPKNGVLNFLSAKSDPDRKSIHAITGSDGDAPPPLPPRPGRGSRLNPNKPFIQTDANMKTLQWTRIILKDESEDEQSTIWHTMMEPKLDAEEIERLFSTPVASQTDGATLYDDLIIRRGRSRQQLASIYETDRSKRIVVCMKCLRATLTDVIACVSSLDMSQIHHDGLAELMELLSPSRDIDKILYHVRKKGAGHLDHPEYLVFELSKVDHFRDRLEFIRFRFRLLWHLFEIDQQMRELHTACDEITSSISLKNLLETLLAVGNYLNGATEMGQADGYGLDVLNKLKDLQDRDGKGTLLEFVLKTYCQIYESEVDIGCPTRFRLPEPSNMRHAAQVSFEGIQDALSNLHSDLRHIREKLLDPKVNKDTMRPMDSFRVSAENFFAAALEVIGEQEKVLQDTRDVFDRTTAFFLLDRHQVTPQQFFHIWAVFLHDCKYFWKLAHRRLARERFELEFKYKGQESASSLQGYGTFRAGVLQGTESTSTADPKTSTATRKPNRWAADIPDSQSRPNVPPKPSRSRNPDEVYNPGSDRSSSPKPLTSNPPSSVDVRKPLPKAPIPTTAAMTNGTTTLPSFAPNYENQSELDRYQQQHSLTQFYPTNSPNNNPKAPISSQETSPHAGSSSGYRTTDNSTMQSMKDKKPPSQFSLKAWLKREREQVRKGVESDTESQVDTKTQTQNPSKGFSKFKSSVMQKFSGNSGNKKNETPKRNINKDTNVSPPGKYDFDTPPAPYDILKNNYQQRLPAGHSRGNDIIHMTSQDPRNQEPVISPIDDPDAEEFHSFPGQNNQYSHQNGQPPQLRANLKPDIPSGRHKGSDLNNNEKHDHLQPVWQPDVTETPYGRSNRVSGDLNKGSEPLVPTSQDNAFISPGAESKRIVAQAAPVYKARVINNYENQGKFEHSAVRQHAEPVKPVQEKTDNDYRRKHTLQNDNSNDPRNPYYRFSSDYSRNKSSEDILQARGQGNQNSNQRQNNNENSPYGQLNRAAKSPNRYPHVPETPRKRALLNNTNYVTPGNRAPMNVQSIGSLIDKFDKYNNNSNANTAADSDESKPETMTSTPVASRKTPVTNGDVINEATPPLPPRASLTPKSAWTPNTGSGHDQRGISRYASPERPPRVTSPPKSEHYQTRSITHHVSPPSVYSTPQGGNNPTKTHSYSHLPLQNSNNKQNSVYSTPPTNGDINSPYRDHMTNGNHVDQSDDRDDGYRAKLRRAANFNQSAFDRYSKGSPQYTGRPSLGGAYETNATSYGSPASVKSPVHNNEEVSYMAF